MTSTVLNFREQPMTAEYPGLIDAYLRDRQRKQLRPGDLRVINLAMPPIEVPDGETFFPNPPAISKYLGQAVSAIFPNDLFPDEVVVVVLPDNGYLANQLSCWAMAMVGVSDYRVAWVREDRVVAITEVLVPLGQP